MQLLEAILAFAVTMAAFWTLVTLIMEGIHRFLLTRAAGFEKMLSDLFDKVVWPRLGKAADQAKLNKIQERKHFLDALGNGFRMGEGPWWQAWTEKLVPARIDSMSTLEFIERLAGTEFGAAIEKQAGTALAAVVNDLALNFERIGDSARLYFERRARAVSVLVAIVLAFTFNVDALRLFKAFVAEPVLAQQVAAQFEEIEKQYLDIQNTAKAADGKPEKSRQEIAREVREAIESRTGSLIRLGLPVGYDFYPGCVKDKEDARCKAPTGKDGILWFLSVLLSGLLIGLGGPYWFNLARALSGALAMLRGAVSPPQKKEAEAAGPAGGQESGASTTDGLPRTPVEVFQTVRAARFGVG